MELVEAVEFLDRTRLTAQVDRTAQILPIALEGLIQLATLQT